MCVYKEEQTGHVFSFVNLTTSEQKKYYNMHISWFLFCMFFFLILLSLLLLSFITNTSALALIITKNFSGANQSLSLLNILPLLGDFPSRIALQEINFTHRNVMYKNLFPSYLAFKLVSCFRILNSRFKDIHYKAFGYGIMCEWCFRGGDRREGWALR